MRMSLLFSTLCLLSCISCSTQQSATGAQSSSRPGGQGGTPPSSTEIVKQMDANNDGQLSKTEVHGPLKNDFSKIDLNQDGFLSKTELEKAPKPTRQRPANRN